MKSVMKKTAFLLLMAVPAAPLPEVAAGMVDDPLLAMVLADQLELRAGGGNEVLAWDAEGWLGYDLNKLWLKTDGEYSDGSMENAELQVLYSRAIAPFWDLQAGWRRDLEPSPDRDWLALGVKGLAPYFFDLDLAVFLGDGGRTEARLQAEYEFMLTQKLILTPEVEMNFAGRDDREAGKGPGLTDIEAGLRLRYEIRREIAPYIGVNWSRLYGDSADYALDEGEDIDSWQAVVGIRTWF